MTTTVAEMDVRVGGKWRFVMRESDGTEQCFRASTARSRHPTAGADLRRRFPGHVIVETFSFEELEATKLTTPSLFHTTEERDGMLASGMEGGLTESHDRLAELQRGRASRLRRRRSLDHAYVQSARDPAPVFQPWHRLRQLDPRQRAGVIPQRNASASR